MSRRRSLTAAVALAALATATAGPALAKSRGHGHRTTSHARAARSEPPVTFGSPVKVTPDLGGGYEPGVIADRYGNLYATAHKENAELVVSPDSRNPAATRSQSWAWYSADHGRSWKNLPEGPGDYASHTFGDEGDLATDDAGGTYMVDTNVGDINFTAWHSTGRGAITFTRHSPVVGTGEAVDDRPWVAAHGDGHVFYFANEGDQNTYPTGNQGEAYGNGTGPGRYTVYPSYDGGQTWDHVGTTLKGSGWCRPAAAPHSPYVYALCTDDSGADGTVNNPGDPGYTVGHLYAYVSADDGRTWNRYDTGTTYNGYPSGGYYSWPTLSVAPDGSLWGLYLDQVTPGCTASGCTPTASRYVLLHSTNHGKSWTRQVVDPTNVKGVSMYAWLAVSPDGRHLGLATYRRSGRGAPWYVYGAVFRPGQTPKLVSLDPQNPVSTASSAPGDFLSAAFDPDGKLNVVWTRVATAASTPVVGAYVFRDIYSARQN